jgi:hypothetical protein
MATKGTRKGSGTHPAAPAATPPWLEAIERRGFWVALGGLALLLVLFFNPVFFGGKTFQPPDAVASLAHQPYIQESFHSPGSLLARYPLWTPYIFSGMPSFGSLIAAPYTNPMSLLLTPIQGTPKVVVYYLLLGIFTWLFLRRRGASVGAALFGAVAYVFTAQVATMIMFGHNSKIATLVFLPLVLLATEEIWIRPRFAWAAILALAVGTMLVSSHLQVAYYTFLAVGLYGVIAVIQGVRERMGAGAIAARLGTWGAGFAIGLAASAVLFLPVHEYAAHSIRGGEGGGLTYDYATNWSFHPLEITNWVSPSFMGFGGATYWGWAPFTDFPHYMGILVLCLAVLAVVLWPRERLHLYFLILALFGLIMAFGRYLPVLYNLFFSAVPYFNKFRVPKMILLLTEFSTAMLGALALGRIAAASRDEARRIWTRARVVGGALLAIVILLGGLMAGGTLRGSVESRLAGKSAQYGVPPSQSAAFAAKEEKDVEGMAGRDAAVTAVILAAGLALIWGRCRGKVPGWALVGGALVLTVIDLWRVDARPAKYYAKQEASAFFVPTPAVDFLKKDPEPYRILPLTGEGQNNNWYAYFKISSILGYHPAKLKIYQDVIDENGPVGIVKTLSHGNFNVVDMLNMKYVVADREIAVGPLETVFRDRQFVMRNNAALPRMWFVDRARVIADPAAHLAALADTAWDPRTEALLFDDVGALDPGTGGTAQVTRYYPREIDARVESPGNSLLVLSEVYYEPGWKAWLDGAPVPIQRADYLLRAVKVPPGSHTLRMRFDEPSFLRGAILSLSAYSLIFLALIGAAVKGWRDRRARAAGA